MESSNKSIEELENTFWPAEEEYASGLVERCHRYRKIKLRNLQIHQIITLLIQDIGSDILLPIMLERMKKDITEEDENTGGTFVESLENITVDIFSRNPQILTEILDLLKEKQDEVEQFLGWKGYNRIIMKMEPKKL